MTQYVLAYYGEPQFENEAAGAIYQEKWMAWIQSLGNAPVNPAIPLKSPQVVTLDNVTDGASKDRLTGLTIVNADSIEAAVQMAKGCPHLEYGRLDVAEVMDM